MAEIGILHGTLESFPQAIYEELNSHRRGCCCFLKLDALDSDDREASGWTTPVVLDLFSRRLPFLNESLYLVWQYSSVKVLNEPKTLRLHNRATVRNLARLGGLKTGASFLLPARESFPPLPDSGFVNLAYPVSWDRVLKACGPYPVLQSLSFSGEQGALISDLGTLWRRYNVTGSGLQELVSQPSSDRLFRVFFVGEVILVREMDPLTRELYPSKKISQSIQDPLIAAARKLRKEIHLYISCFDLGWDGKEVEYLDLNPDPTLEWWNLGEKDFALLVEGAVQLLKTFLTPQVKTAKISVAKKTHPGKAKEDAQ